jgi:isopenicillin N synthase-like dioxygenase
MIPERYSVAFFSFPDAATIVEPLPTCCSEQAPKKWSPINAGEYLLKKRTAIYS